MDATLKRPALVVPHIFIDFSGAAVIAFVTGSAFHVAAPVILLGLLAVSWSLRPPSRVLAASSVTYDPWLKGALQ